MEQMDHLLEVILREVFPEEKKTLSFGYYPNYHSPPAPNLGIFSVFFSPEKSVKINLGRPPPLHEFWATLHFKKSVKIKLGR